MKRVTLYRAGALVLPVLLLEALCRAGIVSRMTMPPPSVILADLPHLLMTRRMQLAILKTLTNVAIAFAGSVVVGIAASAVIHRLPPLRRVLDPLFATYYAIPVYAFYPLFIILFGLGDAPQVLIGFMLAIVAVIVSTLNGLDAVPAVLTKTARLYRMGPLQTVCRVTLPYATPHLFTGVKLAISYAFIGVIGAEFIMSQSGMGYEIRYAFDNFDNAVMYPLILLILVVAVVMNAALGRWEARLALRRVRG